jgi:hypothetical protein
MCTYNTEKIEITGSGKGAQGWFSLTDATVYFDHPVHAMAEHTLNIDFRNPGRGPAARVAVELTAESARALAAACPDRPLTGRLARQHAGFRNRARRRAVALVRPPVRDSRLPMSVPRVTIEVYRGSAGGMQ